MGKYFSKVDDIWACEYCDFETESRGEMLSHHNPDSEIACPVRFGEEEPKKEIEVKKAEGIEDFHQKAREIINAKLIELSKEERMTEIQEAIEHGLKKGKRFRPTLTLLVAKALDGDMKQALTHAACIELFHASTLAHDDIIDMDETRRGMPSLYKFIKGLPTLPTPPGIPEELNPKRLATLVGDGMMAKALINVSSNPEVVKAASQALYSVLRGAMMESKRIVPTVRRMDIYEQINRLKTGSLFGLATEVGALSTDCPPEIRNTARRYGVLLGLAYQYSDDLAEEDIPFGIKEGAVKEGLVETIKECRECLSELPENEYTGMLREAPKYMVKKMLTQEGKEEILKQLEITS